MMKKNMGITDTVIRILLALVFIILFYMKIITGTLGIVLLIFAGVFLLTSFVSFCPLYTIFGFKTCSNKKTK